MSNENNALRCHLIGFDAMLFLPSALNAKMKEFNKTPVNDGSKCDSLKVAKRLVA